MKSDYSFDELPQVGAARLSCWSALPFLLLGRMGGSLVQAVHPKQFLLAFHSL